MPESDEESGDCGLEENDGGDSDGRLELEDNDECLQLEENDAAYESDGGSLELEDNDTPLRRSVAELKASGNAAFREGRLNDAREAYSEALTASHSLSLGAETNAERATLLANRAACALKLSDWAAAISDCTAALSMGDIAAETRDKALYRRATAFLESGDVDGARYDLAQLPPSDAKVLSLQKRLPKADCWGSNRNNCSSNGGNGGNGGGSDGTHGGGVTVVAPICGGACRRWRVSCISPTTVERHLFHETALYRCFNAQTHADIELIVVDTGAAPSPFFTSPSFSDSRVKYLYQRQHQTIGEKRNLAIQHATGDIICHFDDDVSAKNDSSLRTEGLATPKGHRTLSCLADSFIHHA